MIINPSRSHWAELVKRPELDQKDLSDVILEVYANVAREGDQALREYTSKFDKVEIDTIEVQQKDVSIDPELQKAIGVASKNITKFHKSQIVQGEKVETTKGVICWQESRPIRSVGLYIPGGTAPLFSSVLMLALPAKIAGCEEIILCTPPDRNGNIDPAILHAAKVAGITKVFRVGGSQAIAGMCLGTESIPKVQKIFGPGNQYVTASKQHALSLGTPIDMPAGPSELLVIASKNSIPKYVAADLLSQAEHGSDSQVICLSMDVEQLKAIEAEVLIQLEKLPRKAIAKKAIENSKFICLECMEDLLDFSNLYAPEHLIIADDQYDAYIAGIVNAGSVFLGNYCPESAGDYASGTNHTLPTAGFATVYSGVNLDAFVKKVTFQKITKEGILNLGRTIEVMAEAEGLIAHKNAVTLRLEDLKTSS